MSLALNGTLLLACCLLADTATGKPAFGGQFHFEFALIYFSFGFNDVIFLLDSRANSGSIGIRSGSTLDQIGLIQDRLAVDSGSIRCRLRVDLGSIWGSQKVTKMLQKYY